MNIRNSARAVMINERGEMLLFKFTFHRRDGSKTLWVTPGGGLEEGESFEEALKREVFEETGVMLDAVGPWIWTKEMRFEGDGQPFLSHERYYLVKVAGSELELDNMTDVEKGTLKDCKWWSAEEIRQSSGREPFSISRLWELLEEINEGKIPPQPVSIV
jgi:8-oxo-dGTP pyrophosphatase MutT (NUDIX family)